MATDYSHPDEGPLVRLCCPGNVVVGRIRALPGEGEGWVQLRGRSGSRFAVAVSRIHGVFALEPVELAARPLHRLMVERLSELAGVHAVDVRSGR